MARRRLLGANRFVKALNRCLLLCGYTLAGPPSRTKCGTCSIYGVHCSPKWLVRALREGLITTGCPRRGFRLGRRLPEAGPRALRPHHRRLRGHQKTARHQIALAARHHRTATDRCLTHHRADFAPGEIRHVLPVGLRPPKFQSVNPPSLRSIGIPKTPDREAVSWIVLYR